MRVRARAESRTRAAVRCCAGAATILFLATLPRVAIAAFELRDASPAALGAASTDIATPRLIDAGLSGGAPSGSLRPGASDARRFRLAASHAAIFQIEGLSADRLEAALGMRGLAFDFSFEQVGGAGASEQSARVTVGERSSRAISIEVALERLDLSAEGEPRAGGWTLGGGSVACLSTSPVLVELLLVGDRVIRSAALERMDVEPSLAAGLRLRAHGAGVTILDRWEGEGLTSPRVFLDVALGGAFLIRVGRGESPSRTGAAISVRVGSIEAGVGRLDFGWGGAVTGLSIGWAPRPKRAGES